MSTPVLISLFRYKTWANAELFALLGALPPERSDALSSCVRTLNHVYVVDRIFQAHLRGEPRPFDATNTTATPSLGQLRDDVGVTDAWYESHVSSITPSEHAEILNFTFTDGEAGEMSREEILLHVITHGGYHRGNVGQILKSISVVPPRDLYTRFLHQRKLQSSVS